MSRTTRHHAVESVLKLLGIPKEDRLTERCQDPEYTACRPDELSAYFELYRRGGLKDEQLEVLCCFILESLNDLEQSQSPSPLFDSAIAMLWADRHLHADELAYWTDTNDPNPEHWWPIRKRLLEAIQANEVEEADRRA